MDYISTFRIPIEKIPEAKKWKVGGKYRVVANVEQTGVNKERDYNLEVGPSLSKSKDKKSRFRTMVEFKVFDISAKTDALKKKIK